ncbi:hypothetical protein [Streptomyces cucumeris]|uniref:hypothetical protein n=1 Tax=Streptomyces cucumeris TaxID=2962890 RepID=UPI003EB8CCBC
MAGRPYPVFGEVRVGYLVAGHSSVLDRGRILAVVPRGVSTGEAEWTVGLEATGFGFAP